MRANGTKTNVPSTSSSSNFLNADRGDLLIRGYWEGSTDTIIDVRSRRIPRDSLLQQKASAWRKLFESRNDQSFVTLTGLDVTAFENLLPRFTEFYVSTSPTPDDTGKYRSIDPASGRTRFLRAEDCLGLVLVWTRTRGFLYVLQVIFGISYKTTSDYITLGIKNFA